MLFGSQASYSQDAEMPNIDASTEESGVAAIVVGCVVAVVLVALLIAVIGIAVSKCITHAAVFRLSFQLVNLSRGLPKRERERERERAGPDFFGIGQGEEDLALCDTKGLVTQLCLCVVHTLCLPFRYTRRRKKKSSRERISFTKRFENLLISFLINYDLSLQKTFSCKFSAATSRSESLCCQACSRKTLQSGTTESLFMKISLMLRFVAFQSVTSEIA